MPPPLLLPRLLPPELERLGGGADGLGDDCFGALRTLPPLLPLRLPPLDRVGGDGLGLLGRRTFVVRLPVDRVFRDEGVCGRTVDEPEFRRLVHVR